MASSKSSGFKARENPSRSEDWANLATATSFALLIAPDGTIIAANEAVARRLEIPLPQFVGSCIYDHFPGEAAERRRAMAKRAMESGAAQYYEDVSTSGNVLDTVIHPVLEQDGKITALAVFVTDVTGQQRIVHERLRMATAIEQAVEAVVIYDTTFSIRYVNQAFEEMTGYSQSEVRGQSGETLYQGIHQQKSLKLIRAAMDEGDAWTGRTFNTRKDGRVIQVEKTVSPIRGRFGVPLGWVSVWRDVTHVAVLEKQLRQAQKMEAIGTLAGGIAHDFNNILGPIILHAELGQTMLPEGSSARLSFSEILEAANRARELVDQILSLSRKHEADDPVLFRLSSICKECIKFLRPSLPATIAIVDDVKTEDDVILADPTQIHQVIMNLATNAGHAMRESGGTLTLAVQAVEMKQSMRSLFPDAEVGSYVMLTVKDTGQGMPEEHLERAFDPFFTTKKSIGTGLGLTVVHNIVARHGGAVRLESKPGVGTAFHVLLPRSSMVMPASVLASDVGSVRGSGRILFVDDEAALRTSTSMALELLGYEVTCCSSGQAAYDLFREQPGSYALVLADVTMPGMTGLDLARRIMSEYPETRVVLTSGFSELINPEKAKEMGIGFLKKPYSTNALGLAVRDAIEPGGRLMANILIVDDDTMLVNALSQVLASMGHSADGATTLVEGLEMARGNGYELVILDVRLPDGNGLEALPRFREGPGAPEVIILTGAGDPDGAEMAIRSGAWSYITKPPTMNNIRLPVERAVEYRRNKKESGHKLLAEHGVVGESSAIKACLRRAAQGAGCDAAVLITGDTGTGKELVARAIHDNSRRKAGPFVVVDCAALPENLVESMLFGHEKGSFTGADRRYGGLVHQADGGTLFLDEVGELPLVVQRAFLRVLQDHRFRPVGGSKELTSDFRLLAATNRDLEDRVRQGLFREDLLFRIRGLSISLPSLADRDGDVKVLAGHFLKRFCGAMGIVPKGMSKDFLDALHRYSWPGNVRELMGAMEHSLASAEGEPNLLSRHLPTNVRVALARAGLGEEMSAQAPVWSIEPGEFPSLKDFRDSHLADLERFYLEEVMRHAGWKVAKAIEMSGLSRARLYALLKKYGVSRPRRSSFVGN